MDKLNKKTQTCSKLIEEYKKEKIAINKIITAYELYHNECFDENDIPIIIDLLRNEKGLFERIALSSLLGQVTKSKEKYHEILNEAIFDESDLIKQARLILIDNEKKPEYFEVLSNVLKKDKPTSDIFEVAFFLLKYEKYQKSAIERIQKLQAEKK